MIRFDNQYGYALFTLCFLAIGCADSVPRKKFLKWDFSAKTVSKALNGGTWVSGKKSNSLGGLVYHVTGDRDLAMSVIIQDGQRFDFDCVKHAYTRMQGKKIRTVDIASCGQSEQAIVDRLEKMHDEWNGDGIGDIEQWRTDMRRGLSTSHATVIHRSTGPADPTITAVIRDNFGSADEAWFIMVTFFWNTP